jgi:hypothetical protein
VFSAGCVLNRGLLILYAQHLRRASAYSLSAVFHAWIYAGDRGLAGEAVEPFKNNLLPAGKIGFA